MSKINILARLTGDSRINAKYFSIFKKVKRLFNYDKFVQL